MASSATRTLRRAIRGQDSGELEAMLASKGPGVAPGWHDPRTGERTAWGAIAIAIIRAELQRRARRARRRLPAHWLNSAGPEHFAAVARRMKEDR